MSNKILTPTVYLNGRFVSEPEALISVYDGGWLHGAGLFETMRAENGRIFRLQSHIERLRRSASKLLADIPENVLPDERVFEELLEGNKLSSARVRMTVTAGSTRVPEPHDGRPVPLPAPTVCVTAARLTGYHADLYEKGVAVAVCDFRLSPSDPLAGHKTTSHLPRLLALRQAHRMRCMEALWFTTANRLAEGAISNILLFHKDVLKTPPLDTPVLPGIARGVVLDIARETGIETRECPLTIDELLGAEEVLLTNAIMQVMPVIRIEKHDVGDGRVGPLARKLLAEYRKRVKEECGER